MDEQSHGATGADRRAHIESALARYPYVDAETLADLLYWFRKEASALDVGMIASEPRLSAAYQKLKADHIDRFSGPDLFRAAVFVMMAVGSIGLMIWAGL